MKSKILLIVLLSQLIATLLGATENTWDADSASFGQFLAAEARRGRALEVLAKETKSDCVYQFTTERGDRTIDVFFFIKAQWVRDNLYYPSKGYAVSIRRLKKQEIGVQTRSLDTFKLLQLFDAVYRNEVFSLKPKSPSDIDLEVNPIEVHARMFLNGKSVQIDRRVGESIPMSNVWRVVESLVGDANP